MCRNILWCYTLVLTLLDISLKTKLTAQGESHGKIDFYINKIIPIFIRILVLNHYNIMYLGHNCGKNYSMTCYCSRREQCGVIFDRLRLICRFSCV